MKAIVCALHCEAKPIIKRLKLQKIDLINAFQVFKADDVHLVISGVGRIKAVIATAALLSKISSEQSLNSILILNIGTCGARPELKPGTVVLPHTITSAVSKRKFFQDIITRHEFKEVSLLTSEQPLSDPTLLKTDCVDMEAHGFYEAAASFLKTVQIYTIKIVSDHCSGEILEKDLISKLLEDNLDAVFEFVDSHHKAIRSSPVLNNNERELLERLSKTLKLTAFQKNELANIAASFKIRKKLDLGFLSSYESLRPNSKQDSKVIFSKIQAALNV